MEFLKIDVYVSSFFIAFDRSFGGNERDLELLATIELSKDWRSYAGARKIAKLRVGGGGWVGPSQSP